MAWYLDINPSNSAGQQYISIPNINITGDFTIELDCEIYNTTDSNADGFVFSGGTTGGGFEFYRDGSSQSYRPSLWYNNTKNFTAASASVWPYVSGSTVNPRRITIQRIGHTITSNFAGTLGTNVTIASGNNILISAIGARPNGTYALGMRLYKLKITWSGGTRTYNPNLSAGTGVSLLTEEGGNAGTFNNPPANNAQWIFYSSITTTGIPNNTLGAALNQPCDINLNNYFTGATSYSVVSGSLPTGLSISGNQIVGTPTSAQSTTLVIRASNSIDLLDSETITFNTGLWLLRFPTSADSRITLPTSITAPATQFKLELDFVFNATAAIASYLHSNTGSSFDNGTLRIDKDASNALLVIITLDGKSRVITTVTGAVIDTRLLLTIEWDSTSKNIVIKRDATTMATLTGYNTFNIAAINTISTNLNSAPFDLYSLKVTSNGALIRNYDPSASGGTGTILPDTVSAQNGTQAGTWPADDSEWISYAPATNSNQHQTSGASALQECSGVANTSIVNSQQHISSASANQAFNAVATSVQVNGQRTASAAGAAQISLAVADAQPLNNQNNQTTGNSQHIANGTAQATASNVQQQASAASGEQRFSAQAAAGPLNTQHRQSTGQAVSVTGFIASTSWVNTVDLGEVQHQGTSASGRQAFSSEAATAPLNSQQRQTTGTAENNATASATTTASNSQHRQSAAELRSVAGFIASTSWVNTVDLGNIQHRGTSGSSTQATTAAATATAINSQNRQSAERANAECTATAGTSRVNTILQKAVYIRRIESRSITKKIYHTASRHKIELKTQRGGGYMQELNFKQGASALLQIEHTIDGEPVSGISDAKYELYGRTGQVLVTKSLGEGIEFSAGLIEIQLTEDDTADLSQSYNHQCVAKDMAGLTFFPLNGQITFGATKPRL